jgi:hypothetical protein
MCISPGTCNTFCNKANWVPPHYFPWRWKLTHFTKCAVLVMREGGLTPWSCKHKISPKCRPVTARMLFFMLSAMGANFRSYVFWSVLNTRWWLKSRSPVITYVYHSVFVCWPCTQIQNTIKCATNAQISTVSSTIWGGDNQSSVFSMNYVSIISDSDNSWWRKDRVSTKPWRQWWTQKHVIYIMLLY